MDYVKFKLENTYLKVGKYIRRQIGGVPMGGKVSSQLAEIDCMWKEHNNVKKWKGKYGGLWMRYRDDIRVVLSKKWGSRYVKELVAKVNGIYGDKLEVVLEDFGYERMNFLDVRVVVGIDKMVCFDNNKNYDVMEEKENRMKLMRFPEMDGGMPRKYIVGMMIGMLKNTGRKCTTDRLRVACWKQNLIEFRKKGYSERMVMRAMYGAGQKVGDACRKWYREEVRSHRRERNEIGRREEEV
jgi:hypothetical protein